MKTYTLPVKAMAQLVSGSTYDKTSERYNISGKKVFVEFENLPTDLIALNPSSITLKFYTSGFAPYSAQQKVYDGGGQIIIVRPGEDIPEPSYHYETVTVTPEIYVCVCKDKLSIENNVFPADGYSYYIEPSGNPGWTDTSWPYAAQNAALNGITLKGFQTQASTPAYVYSPRSEYAPYAVLSYNEGSPVAYADGPSGYIDRTAETVFSWRTTWTGFPIEDAAQTSATLQWKNGQSGTINSIPISGADTTYTMAANTLPESSDLYWRVQTVTSSGSATSDWRAIRTVDTEAVAVAVSPSGAYVDGAQTARFVWTYATASGAPQYGYDLAVRGPADADFSIIQSETTANAFADVPAGTLPGGQILWRVRAYNQSGVAGEWSAALTCVVIAAPNAPEVWFEAVSPRPTVAWSAVGQLGYQVRVEGVYDSGTVFGTDKAFKIPVYLPDGMTTVQVRVLGEYDYWSPWGSASANIANPSSGSVTLTVREEDGDAVLTWIGTVQTPVFEILRGGKKIGETLDTTWTDRYANGETTYRIRAIPALHPDRYALSDPVSVSLRVESPRLTAFDGAWIVLDTYTNPLPQTQISATRDVALTQYAGMDYPAAEVSRHRTRTYICNPAFADPAQAAAFEALLGRPVFVKDQYGTTMTGVMASVQRSVQRFYTVVTAVIQEIGGYEL